MKTKITLLLIVALVTLLAAWPVVGAPNLTNFTDHVHILTTGATATPALMVNQRGAGKIFELKDGGTPVFSVNNGGGVTGAVLAEATPNLLSNCWTATITDTAAYTSLITALSTPSVAWCNVTVLSADALHCGAIVAQGLVTITVRNSAVTPAANAAGVSVYSCAKGSR